MNGELKNLRTRISHLTEVTFGVENVYIDGDKELYLSIFINCSGDTWQLRVNAFDFIHEINTLIARFILMTSTLEKDRPTSGSICFKKGGD